MEVNDLEVCPYCLGAVNSDGERMVCQKCLSSFQKGDKITLTLKQAMLFKTKNDRKKKDREWRINNQYNYIPKKPIPHKTGFFGVRRKKGEDAWRYYNRHDCLSFQSVSLIALREKVLEAGGRWGVVYRPSALKSAELEGVSLEELE